jgi:hypothetical protein
VHEVVDEPRDVVTARAQGRQRDVDDVEAVEEVLAEAAGVGLAHEVTVGAGDEADVDRQGLGGADGPHLLVLDDAQELDLEQERQLADLVEEQRPLVGDGEEPGVGVDGARERAFEVAEELALEQRLRNRSAVHRHERVVAPGTGGMDRARHQLLAGAALARDEDVGGRRRAAGDLPAYRLDGDARADEVLPDGVPMDHALTQARRLKRASMLQHAGDAADEIVDAERLLQVVTGAFLQRLDGRLDGGVAGDHDDGRERIHDPRLLEDVEPAEARKDDVGDDDVEVLRLEAGQGLLGAAGGGDVVASYTEGRAEHLLHPELVVHDEDGGAGHAHRTPPCAAERIVRPTSRGLVVFTKRRRCLGAIGRPAAQRGEF